MNVPFIQDTAIPHCPWKSDLRGVLPANTWRKGAFSRRLRRLLLDHRCISVSSLFVTFGVQSYLFGKTSGTGLCFILLAHEVGHVLASRQFSIPVLWPVFIPKVGAFILLKEKVLHPYHEAWLGISGPIAGLLATGAVDLVGFLGDSADLKSCATAGYAMHLFNLIPLGDLDGGHVASFIGKWLWILGAALLLGLLLHLSNLAWHTTLVILWVLCSGCMKMRRWILSKGSDFAGLHEFGKTAKLRMASLYGLLILVCVLGLFSRPL